MTRGLVIIACLVVAAFATLIMWPREDTGPRAPAASPEAAAQAEGAASNFTVLVDGEQVSSDRQQDGRRLADLPVDQWTASMVSSIRSLGGSQVVVFTDGSEAVIDSFVRSRLPQDVAYRAGYSRD